MATAARMQTSLERGAPEDGRSAQHDREAAADSAAIDEVMRAAEREESWPQFIGVLRARGPELRERMLRLDDPSDRSARDGEARSLRRPLLARLADAGLAEESLERLDHARRVMARARGLWRSLESARPLPCPRAHEHAREGESAAWMHAFALLLLDRVAGGATAIARPSTELAVMLAVETARDASAHWATALELLAESDAA